MIGTICLLESMIQEFLFLHEMKHSLLREHCDCYIVLSTIFEKYIPILHRTQLVLNYYDP